MNHYVTISESRKWTGLRRIMDKIPLGRALAPCYYPRRAAVPDRPGVHLPLRLAPPGGCPRRVLARDLRLRVLRGQGPVRRGDDIPLRVRAGQPGRPDRRDGPREPHPRLLAGLPGPLREAPGAAAIAGHGRGAHSQAREHGRAASRSATPFWAPVKRPRRSTSSTCGAR